MMSEEKIVRETLPDPAGQLTFNNLRRSWVERVKYDLAFLTETELDYVLEGLAERKQGVERQKASIWLTSQQADPDAFKDGFCFVRGHQNVTPEIKGE